MTESTQDSAENYAIALLIHYCFELGGYPAEEVVARWFTIYPVNWVRLAIIEALYQGRYKAVSVEQILGVWYRRNQAIYHFNHEFERLVCRKFPQTLIGRANLELPSPPLLEEPETVEEIEVEELETIAEMIAEDRSLPEEADTSVLTFSVVFSEKSAITAENTSESVLSEPLTELAVEDKEPVEATFYRPPSPVTYEANRTRYELSKRPIHQFVPSQDDSEFYLKLKAVAKYSNRRDS